ncbi:hypothetical protein BN1708_010020 [Verticillium longisporum]|uniref:Amino acid transporter transmembrane domain-containing protein n=1 Tax=Verticillium longisporum TaxID=100787 RepID=A0A0G4KMR1_VERLO|nr:hypothetical protein BN1708_010020 [Verticillium longisporum]
MEEFAVPGPSQRSAKVSEDPFAAHDRTSVSMCPFLVDVWCSALVSFRLVGNPVQLFPALRIIEGKIFQHRSGKKDLLTKWKKNVFRTMLIALCIAISIGGSANLDRFVALIGSFACVPLVYIYPPYLHYKGVAGTRKQKLFDIGLMTLGLVGMVYTTAITLATNFL